jgi:Fe-S oxidoreductase
MNEKIGKAFRETKAYYCLECGKCTSACPVSINFNEFSPRLLVKEALLGFDSELLSDRYLWDCLTCNLCNDVCMSDVKLPEFIRAVREEALKVGNKGNASHCEVPHAVARLLTNPNLNQDRLTWLTKDMKTSSSEGEYLFWTGCSPYFKTVFSDFDDATEITKAALLLLNYFGIEPVVLPNERCCGHDMLWLGQSESFKSLREQNIKSIESTKAEKIITPCAEGYFTLKNDYNLNAEVMHISQFLADKIENNNIEFKNSKLGKVTYHDPCRLGRFANVYEAPRKVLEALPGVELIEMERSKHKSPCCGVSAWMNCDDFSKKMRFDKLRMAKDTKASILATSCPKCRIHLRCYTANTHVKPQIDIEVEDITVLAAKSLGLLGKKKVKK